MERRINSEKYHSNLMDKSHYPYEIAPHSHDIDIHFVLEILRKFKWFLFLSTSLVTFIVAYHVNSITPVYRSTATLLVEPQRTNTVSIEEIYDVDDSNSEYFQTQIELLKSRELARNTIEALDLWDHPELVGVAATTGIQESAGSSHVTDGSKPPGSLELLKASLSDFKQEGTRLYAKLSSAVSESAVTIEQKALRNESSNADDDFVKRDSQLSAMRNFSGRVVVEPVRKTKLIKVSYESTDPELAAEVANEIGRQYIASFLAAKLEVTSKVSQWLSRRLTELKSTLDDSELRLRTFKRENGLVDVDGRVGRLNEQELLLLTQELAAARSQLSSTQDLYNELQNQKEFPEALDMVSVVQADPLVQRNQIEQGQARRQLDELLNRYGDKHPRVVDARSQLTALRNAFLLHIDRIVESTGNDYKLLQQRVSTIEAKLSEGKQEIQEIGSKKFQLNVLEREVETNQELYDIFFSRFTESKSANGLEEANARVAESAVPAPSPLRPRKNLIIAMAALGALVMSILLAFLFERLDDTVKGTKDIERRLGLRLIGVLPLVKIKDRRHRNMPLSPDGNANRAGRFAEAVNAARTALCLEKRSSSYKLILVTSSVPAEGKTTSSVNLAYSFGQQERVLLIDGDMRRPSVGKSLGLDSNVPGLSDLINRTAHPLHCVRRGVVGGAFDVLPAGSMPSHPLELLTSVRFEKILAEFSQHYDRIIIDSAPVHAVSDAMVFSKFADAVVYVVKSHSTPVKIIKQGIDRLVHADANLVGALVTQADMEKLETYGGDIHYGGYYDSYGYADETYDQTIQVFESDFIDEFEGFRDLGKTKVRTIGSEFRSNRLSNNEFDRSLEIDYSP